MKTSILKKIYFQNADDSNPKEFTAKYLSSGLLWIYIALNPEKQWAAILEKLPKNKKSKFISEYNKAFLFTKTYKELTKLFIGREIILKNLFLPYRAEISPDKFIKFTRSDDLRWKEALELVS